MRVFTLDLSTSIGWAYFEGEVGSPTKPELLKRGVIKLDGPILSYGDYPWCYQAAARKLAKKVVDLIRFDVAGTKLTAKWPDVIVVEETNLGKSRYAQKWLEYLHCQVLNEVESHTSFDCYEEKPKVVYLSSSSWRQALKLQLTPEQKRDNARLAKAKREAAAIGVKLDKVKLGIKGKKTKKHVAVDFVNARFGLQLKAKDDDIADAICLGAAFFENATPCDGT